MYMPMAFGQLTAPSLNSPNDNITGAYTRQYMTWGRIAAATGYTLQVDTATTFDSPLLYSVEHSNTSSSTQGRYVNDLRYGTHYYWRVRAYNATDTSAWSVVRTLTTTAKVFLNYSNTPADSLTGAYTRQLFHWNNSRGSIGYILELDTVADFSSPYKRTFNKTTAFDNTDNYFYYAVNDMRYGTRYYWRVRARNNADTSDWSDTRTLLTTDKVFLNYSNTPADSLTGAYTRLLFHWNNSRGSIGYILELDTVSDFSSPHKRTFNKTTSVDNTDNYFYYAVNDMRYGTRYYWRVRARNSVDTSGWSDTRTLLTTDKVFLNYSNTPADSLTGAYTRQFFHWNNSRGSIGYILELDTVADFSSPHKRTFNKTTAADNTDNYFYYAVNDMRYGTRYYWRVRARNGVDTSGWSDTRTLTTTYRAFLNSPADNSTGWSVSGLYLYWNNSRGSTKYIIQIDTSATFSSSLLQTLSKTTSADNTDSYFYKIVDGLRYGTTYRWRVCAINNADTSEWSAVWRFTTTYNITTGPALTMPVNDSTGLTYNNITLVWQPMDNVQGYRYEVSTSSTFETLVAAGNTSLTFSVVTTALPSTTYYWRVQGYNAQGNTAWSSVWHFTTDDVTLTAPGLATPANGSSQPVNVDLAWHPVFGALTYDLQLSFDNNFTGAVSSFSTADTHYTVSGLPQNMTFYWRARSNNGNAHSEWSEVRSFVTNDCQPVSDTVYHEMCEGQSYEFFGTSYTATGNYSHLLTTAAGCDSTVVLVLTVHPRGMDGSVIDTACDSYTWNDLTFIQSGNYPFYTTTVHGCDSMAILYLTIYNSVTENIYDTATGVYEWNGEYYSVSGDYTQNFSTVQGCDSTVVLHLTVTVGIADVAADDINIFVRDNSIIIEGIKEESVKVFDMEGRLVGNHNLPNGVYMVKVGSLPARKVVVIR